MKILSMTATFGKLENQTLTLQPGLNVIHAPNEWGKSTWCAFLITMLYGLDTREKTTKTNLAMKERYAPWSGAPMSGSMDILWQGRKITIQRWTKGRIPMGEFQAFETESGIAVPELNALNCGQTLLGVERSVFQRAGFLRLADLPLTQDESLRRRLNALVTTGDENNAGDLLAQKLKDLKNKVRYNRSGLLPQAEAQQAELESKLGEIHSVQEQLRRNTARRQELEEQITDLENHKAWLAYAAAEEKQQRVAEAEKAAQKTAEMVQILEKACGQLPNEETAREELERLQALQQQQANLMMEADLLPPLPQEPVAPAGVFGLDAAKAEDQVHTDIARFHELTAMPKKSFPFWIPGVMVAIVGIVLLVMRSWIVGGAGLAIAAGLLVAQLILGGKHKVKLSAQLREAEDIRTRYDGGDPQDWLAAVRAYGALRQVYEAELAYHTSQKERLETAQRELRTAILEATGGEMLSEAMVQWEKVLQKHEALATARREQQLLENHAEALRAVAQKVERPEKPDKFVYPESLTMSLLDNARFEAKQRQTQFAQCQGRMEALGSEEVLQKQLDAVSQRVTRLSETYAALELAQNTLAEAAAELQRRFAPRIAKKAQELFACLTGGRYDRMTLAEDLSVSAGAAEETVLRTALWRSEGTVDQLYLALRLAVAEELTPEAPLILDDILVRFDDIRHAAAMEIFRETAKNKQILLFTCQSRELEQ